MSLAVVNSHRTSIVPPNGHVERKFQASCRRNDMERPLPGGVVRDAQPRQPEPKSPQQQHAFVYLERCLKKALSTYALLRINRNIFGFLTATVGFDLVIRSP
jgi:hypothetical protein